MNKAKNVEAIKKMFCACQIDIVTKYGNAEGEIWTRDSHVFSVVLSQAELPRHDEFEN